MDCVRFVRVIILASHLAIVNYKVLHNSLNKLVVGLNSSNLFISMKSLNLSFYNIVHPKESIPSALSFNSH